MFRHPDLPVLLLCLGLALSAAPAQAAASASDFYENALTRVSEDALEAAVIQLKNALQADPDYLPAHILLARVYLDQGTAAAAEDAILEALRRGADPSLTLELLGRALLRQNKFRELLERLDPERVRGDQQVVLQVLRGRALIRLQRLDAAEQTFRAAADADPAAAAPLAGLAEVELRRGDLEQAQALADEAVERDAADASGWTVRGSVAHARGALQDALEHYSRAIELDSRQVEALTARAGLHLDLGRDEAAAADVERLREMVPYDPRVTYLEAVVKTRRGDREEAREALSLTAQIVDGLRSSYLSANPNVLLTGAMAHFGLGAFEQARDYLGRYVDAVPDAVGPRRLLGGIHLNNGDLEAAQAVVEPAVVLAPGDFETISLLARIYARRGLHASAVELLERALELSDGAPEVQTRLAMSELGAGRAERGLGLLAEAFAEGRGFRPAGVSLAVMQLREGRPEEAVASARQLLEGDPGDLSARNLLATSLAAAGRPAEARETLRDLLAKAPEFLPARLNLAKLEIAAGELQAARARLSDLLREHPQHMETMLEMARVERLEGRPGAALDWLQKAYAVDRLAPRAVTRLVEHYLDHGEPARGLETAQAATVETPDDLPLLRVLARAYIANGKPEVAGTIYRDMASLIGFDAEELYDLARLQLGAGAADDALYSLEKAINSAPDFLPAKVGAIEILLSQGKQERAEERALALREQHPELPSGHRLHGEALLARQACSPGIEGLREALALREREALAVRVATAMQACGRGAAAIEFLDDWLRERPGALFARKALAELNLANGREAAALAHYRRVIERFPGEPGVLNNMAYLLMPVDLEQALEHARRAHRADPESASINDTLGWVLVQLGRPEEALPYLREAHSRDSRNPTIRWHLARALHDLGREAEARSEVRLALDSGRSFDGVEEARDLLRELSR